MAVPPSRAVSPEMIDRAGAAAEAGGMTDGAVEVRPGLVERLDQWTAQRKVGGDGRGEHAAGAVGVPGRVSRPLRLDELEPVEERVDDIGRLQVTAFDDDGAC